MPITVTVETGAVVAGANSYRSVADVVTYAANHGLTFVDDGDAAAAAVIRATQAMDATYRNRYPGTRLDGRDQPLEWPRSDATDASGQVIADDEVPTEVLDGMSEMAVREKASPGSMMPDLDRGGAVKSIKAGSVAIDYGANASARTTFTLIDGIMASLLGSSVVDDGITALAVRG